jgi:hypothetical protein
MAGIILSCLILSALCAAQNGSNGSDSNGFENYLKKLPLNQTYQIIQNKTPVIIKEISSDILKINSTDLSDITDNVTVLAGDVLYNMSLCGIDISDISNDNLMPDIKLESVHTDIGFPDLLGYHPDCTFILNNTGDADGVAVINFENDNNILLKKATILAPKKTARKFNEKVDLPLASLGRAKISCYIESQRKAVVNDCLDPYVRKN